MSEKKNEGFNANLFGKENLKPKLDIQLGAFIHYEKIKKTIFRDVQQHEIALERVLLLANEWDFDNGEKNIPKPYLIGENGAIKEYGATVLYAYLNSADTRVVVFGAVQDLTVNHQDTVLDPNTTDYEVIQEKHTSRNNKKRFFTITEDGKGNVFIYLKGKKGESEEDTGTGNIGIKLTGTDENGNLSLTLNGRFAITQTQTDGDTEMPIAQMLFDNTKDSEKIKITDKTKNIFLMNKDGIVLETAAIRIGKTQTLKKILDKLIDAITRMTNNSPGGPTISPPINIKQFTSIKQELAEFMDKQ